MSSFKKNIIVFGQLTDIIGAAEINFPAVGDTDALKNQLIAKYPQLAELSFVIAVDKKIAAGNTPLQLDSGIALLPPFSGG
ncbi:MoaD/ThiS family protein [Flavihumibacter profundi]|jgi:sulfur-carrier protein|uniref:MoaD/ThiS family protein n=1 Tax=Flavihumibacter profundi TaxID=2716883 RepID=UPI001CC5B040|nr:MoaD/ThiS family protein [Flavihumibacter profundi]MBZ5858325.1 MoaD/ThiS family protein [Flavihumibacter profundi]